MPLPKVPQCKSFPKLKVRLKASQFGTFCFSERIGWVPLRDEVPESVRDEYKWVQGLSVTEMEIMHGAYRRDNPNGADRIVHRGIVVLLEARSVHASTAC